jgi:hypothetical protein
MNSTTYGYGHTKEASQVVRSTLKQGLANEIKKYNLKISVRKADSGYGGPRVSITTNDPNFIDYYEYIVDENGQPSNSGKLVSVTASEFGSSNIPYNMAQLKRAREYNQDAKAVDQKIKVLLQGFGRNNDDSMTDYFDNTTPLFYGVDYKA